MVINMILAHINYLQMDVTDRLKNYGAHALLFLNIRRLGQQCQHLFLDPKNVKNSVSPVKKSLLPLKKTITITTFTIISFQLQRWCATVEDKSWSELPL